MDNMKKNMIDIIWEKICANEGQVFTQIRGKQFTYSVSKNTIYLSSTNYSIGKSTIEKALNLMPFENTAKLQHLPAPSYLYAILTDPRIYSEE